MTKSNPVELVHKLEKLLAQEGYAKDDGACQKLTQLKAALSASYDFSTHQPSDYTEQRAYVLHSLSLKLKDTLAEARLGSYATKASALAYIGDAYLKLAHAFKVDAAVWSSAQSDLVPSLTSASDEKTIDEALVLLDAHVDRYVKSLNHWLNRTESKSE